MDQHVFDVLRCIFSLSLYCLFFNIPLRYLLEMLQDLLIAAFVNIRLIGINSHSKSLQIVNFILSLLFILLVLSLLIFLKFLMCNQKYPRPTNELFASFVKTWTARMTYILLFISSWFIMAIFIALGKSIPSSISAFIFTFLCHMLLLSSMADFSKAFLWISFPYF